MKVVIGTRRWLGSDWTHVDADPTPLLDERGGRHAVDVVCNAAAIHLPDQCAELVYSQECLEHFPWREAPLVLHEWARLVDVGGSLRIEVPDFAAACRQFLETDTLDMDRRIQQIIFGGQANQWDYHYTGWTPRMLQAEMESAGLEIIDTRRGWEHGYLLVEGRRP